MPLVAVHQSAIDLIMEFEGLRLSAYPDPATGGDPWTVGFGHTTAAGKPPVFKGMKVTKEEAEAILKSDIGKFSDGVFKLLTMPVNAHQFGALVSLAFNIGLGNFRKSSLLKAVNAGDFETAAAKFALYNRANKKVMAGLTRRRAAEAALFRKPIGNPVQPSPAPTPPPTRLPPVSGPRRVSGGVSVLIAAAIAGGMAWMVTAWDGVVAVTGVVSPWW